MTNQAIGNAIWTYACDLLDDNMDLALDEIANAGLTSISVATAYHTARLLLPHNPRRKIVNLESGRVYFRFDSKVYAELPEPRLASEYANRDPLGEICVAAAKRGLSVQAWTVFLHNSRLGELHPDLNQINCFGDHYIHTLCPSNPLARRYAIALASDIGRHYPIAAIDVEALGFLGYAHNSHHDKASIALARLHQFLLSVCFCERCQRAIRENNAAPQLIAAAFRRELEMWFAGDRRYANVTEQAGLIELIGEANANALMRARDQVVGSLLAEIRRAVPSQIALQIRTASSPFQTGGKTAGDVRLIAQNADGLVFSFFSMPFAKFKNEVVATPWQAVAGKPAWAGVAVAMDTPECQNADEFTQRIAFLRSNGFAQFYFYNYGLMPRACLDWIATALKENR